MNKKFIKVHQIGLRARYKLEILKDNFIDEDILKGYFNNFSEIQSIRVNKKAYSIIFELKKDIFQDIEKRLKTITLENLLKSASKNEASVCVSCTSNKEPSIKGTLLATTALVAERLVTNNSLKAAITSVASVPLLIDGTKELFNDGLTSHVLEAAAVAISIYRKDYLAANSTNAMLELGEYIEETTVHKSDDLLKELARPNIEEAWVERKVDGKVVEVLVKTAELKVGDIVVVGAGSTIAIDGHIIDGAGTINQVSMTGEAEPIAKYRGDRVISGTIVEEGRFRIWAEQVGANTATQRIKHYIENSLNEKSSAQLKANRLADKLVPVTLGLATAAYIFTKDFQRVASVLQADYSCALKLATPVAFKSTISKAGHSGIMIKGAKSIEALSSADTVVFDKTGTLTKGELEVGFVEFFNKDEKSMNLLYSLLDSSNHPVSLAVKKYIKENFEVSNLILEDVKNIEAKGLSARYENIEILGGNEALLKEFDVNVNIDLNSKFTQYLFCIDKKIVANFELKDELKDDAKELIEYLKEQNIESIMLTGDNNFVASSIAKELEISNYKANLTPKDKADFIKDLKNSGKTVVMVGDGVNDSVALASSDVAIAMGNSADVSMMVSDVVMLNSKLKSLKDAFIISKKTYKHIKQNLAFSLIYNTITIPIAAAGFIIPLFAALSMSLSSLVVVLNSLRIKLK